MLRVQVLFEQVALVEADIAVVEVSINWRAMLTISSAMRREYLRASLASTNSSASVLTSAASLPSVALVVTIV